MDEHTFKKFKNSCLMYLDLYKNKYELSKDLLRILSKSKTFNYSDMNSSFKQIKKKDVENLYTEFIGRIYVNKI